jgi:pimeloyl-ACP methyl ester carboxylesterase
MIGLGTWRFSLTTFVVASALACASSASVPATPAAALTTAPTSLLTASDRYFTAADVRIRYRDIGQGEAVVLVHGLARSLEDWAGLGDSLARGHRVIAIDVRGFGKSTRFSEPSRLGVEMANDIVRLLDNLGIRRAHLAGHSMGAAIAAKLATTHPDRVSSVSLVAGPFFDDTAAFRRDEGGFAADVEQGRGMNGLLRWLFPTWSDSFVVAMNAEAMSKNDPATIVAAIRSMDALAVRPSSASVIRAPAAIIVGTGDPLLPQSRWLASWWPGARLVEVAGTDHLTVIFHPSALQAMRAVMKASAR